MSSFRFTKMQGLGNDFVVIDGVRQRIDLDRGTIRRLADRRLGVGCDQVLLVEAPASREIRGSTTIVELLRMFPDGEAAQLMSTLALPCAHCGGAFHEPLTMAAKRHRRDPRAVIEAFRALDAGGPTPAQVDSAATRVPPA